MSADAHDLLDAALRYAQLGYKVHPVRRADKEKRPLLPHGVHDATTDPDEIDHYWRVRYPGASIGLSLDGLVAVDIDPRHGGDVDMLPHKLPETCTAKTGGGGLHFLYRATNGVRYPGKLAPGADCKSGPGAYIVVEPSLHASGATYSWVDESEPWNRPPAEAPAWLAQAHERRAPTGDGEVGAKIKAGGRNTTLTSLAGTMRRRGMSRDAIEAALLEENQAKCSPPLPEDEVRRIAENVNKYEPGARDQAPNPEPEYWPLLDLEALSKREPQPPAFIAEDWLPCGYATLFAGHGGVGKSGIALHLAVCIAAGVPFFGVPVARRRVLYLSCEDRESILHWRLHRICQHLAYDSEFGSNPPSPVDLASLTAGRLHISDLVGRDTILWERDPRTGYTYTPAFATLQAMMREHQIELLVVDGISDTYAGNENARGDVKRYVNALVSLMPAATGAVILVGHIAKPTAANAATTEGYSGSTGWHNAVRARWYLYPETERGEDGGRPERTGELILELQKSNMGRIDQQMKFRWYDAAHLFVGERIGASAFDRKHQDRTEQDGIRRALKSCMLESGDGAPAAMTGPRTAFHVLKVRPEFPSSLASGRAGTRRFWRQIEELRAMRHIDEQSIARKSDRHRVRYLVLTEEGMRACGQ